MKYILQDIPAVLAKANQGLATLDKYRARLDAVSIRLTALEFEGGVVLYDVLAVLQRAELVTRMAVEVERYIVELGTEGRLIEMQLEETMVGVAADKAALIRDYSVEDTEENLATRAAGARAAAAPGPARLRSPRRAARLRPQGSTRSTSRSRPRGYRVLGRIPRLPEAGRPEDHPASSAGWRRSSPPRDDELEAVDGVGDDPGQGHPRGPAQASGGRSGRPLLTELDGSHRRVHKTKGGTNSRAS